MLNSAHLQRTYSNKREDISRKPRVHTNISNAIGISNKTLIRVTRDDLINHRLISDETFPHIFARGICEEIRLITSLADENQMRFLPQLINLPAVN